MVEHVFSDVVVFNEVSNQTNQERHSATLYLDSPQSIRNWN